MDMDCLKTEAAIIDIRKQTNPKTEVLLSKLAMILRKSVTSFI